MWLPLFSGSKALSANLAGAKLGGKSTMFGQGERHCCTPAGPQGAAVKFNIACYCLFHFLFHITLHYCPEMHYSTQSEPASISLSDLKTANGVRSDWEMI